MDPRDVYSYLIQKQGYDPDKARETVLDMYTPGASDLPIASTAGEVVGGLAAEHAFSGSKFAKNLAEKEAKKLANASNLSRLSRLLAKVPYGGAKLLAGGLGASAGFAAGKGLTGERFWDEATGAESLGSLGGSVLAGMAGGSFGGPFGAAAGGMLGGLLGAFGGKALSGGEKERARKEVDALLGSMPTPTHHRPKNTVNLQAGLPGSRQPNQERKEINLTAGLAEPDKRPSYPAIYDY